MAYDFAAGQRQQVAMLTTGGKFFIRPQSVTEFLVDALTGFIYPEYAELWSIWSPESGRDKTPGKPDMRRPQFVTWTSQKTVKKNAKKLARFINQMEAALGIDDDHRTTCIVQEKVGVGKSVAPIIVITGPFWVKSPITLSFFLTILRLCHKMRLGERFDEFFDRLQDAKANACKDSALIRNAVKKGNLPALIKRELAATNREGFSDYLLHSGGRTFAWYHNPSDAVMPLDEESLMVNRVQGRAAELNRMES